MSDTTELLALNDSVPAEGGTITLDADRAYTYEDEYWLAFGNRTVVIEGNGAVLVSAARDQRIMPLGAGPISWDGRGGPDTAQLGQRIASVAAGADTLVLLEGDSSRYQAGDTVLIAGYIQQITQDDPPNAWGWPPNFRYFEYRTVASVMAGALLLAEPLRFSYNAAWLEYPQTFNGTDYTFGAPRVWRWRHDDGRVPNRSLTIRNATFRGNSFSATGLHLRLDNCVVETQFFWPTVCKSVELIDCTLAGMEFDKIAESVSMTGGEALGKVGGGGAGVLSIRCTGTNFRQFVSFVGRDVVFDACRFDRGVHLAGDGALPPGDQPHLILTASGSYGAGA